MVARSIMLNILGEAEGDEGVQRAHAIMARAYQVSLHTPMLFLSWAHARPSQFPEQLRQNLEGACSVSELPSCASTRALPCSTS